MPWTSVLIEGVIIIAFLGGLSALRREGLPLQLILEIAVITLLGAAASLAGFPLNPVLFFVIVYLIVMRARLLVDVGRVLIGQGRYEMALSLFALALRLRPDPLGRLTALTNMGVAHVRKATPDQAIPALEEALAGKPARLAPKFEAACRYNLGVAYERAGRQRDALQQYRQVTRLFPNSIYAHGAQEAIRRAHRRGDV